MQNKNLIKWAGLAIVLVTIIWWLWPPESDDLNAQLDIASGGQSLVSAIQPINNADALTGSEKLPEKLTQALVYTPDARDQNDFASANEAIQSGSYEAAITLLKGIIERQPGLLEPYINLASAQAAAGNLDDARKTLMQGLSANENYGALFSNLQHVHAALAADAYQLALAENAGAQLSAPKKSLRLPLVTALNASVSSNDDVALQKARSQIKNLEAALADKQKEFDAEQVLLAQARTELASNQTSLTSTQEQLKVAESAASLSSEASSTASSKITALETRLTAAQQEIAQMSSDHQAEIASLKQQLQQQQVALSEQQLLAQQAQERQAQELAAQQVAAAGVQTEAARPAPPKPLATDTARDVSTNGIAHVQSWAKAWSAQNVSDYIAHYLDDYSPSGSGLSNADWRAQRQVRLTNKDFIEVTLTDFETERKGDQLQVRFVQRYRSNTMDDTIRKQISLVAPDGDWNSPRIIAEQVVR